MQLNAIRIEINSLAYLGARLKWAPARRPGRRILFAWSVGNDYKHQILDPLSNSIDPVVDSAASELLCDMTL